MPTVSEAPCATKMYLAVRLRSTRAKTSAPWTKSSSNGGGETSSRTLVPAGMMAVAPSLGGDCPPHATLDDQGTGAVGGSAALLFVNRVSGMGGGEGTGCCGGDEVEMAAQLGPPLHVLGSKATPSMAAKPEPATCTRRLA